jgi:hypothetical protein
LVLRSCHLQMYFQYVQYEYLENVFVIILFQYYIDFANLYYMGIPLTKVMTLTFNYFLLLDFLFVLPKGGGGGGGGG